jgi:hypothetical protein
MLIGGLLLGFLLGVVVSLAIWATGRRPYLRVDFEQHSHTTFVHHVVDHDPTATGVPVVPGRVVAPPTLPPAAGRRAVPATARVVKEHRP